MTECRFLAFRPRRCDPPPVPRKLREAARVLEAIGVLTPERVESLRAKARTTGAARAVRAAAAYQQVVADYKRGRVKPLELASAHDELLAALRQNGDEVQAAVKYLADLFGAPRTRSPKR